MKRLILILCCLILLPLPARADETKDSSGNDAQQEAVEESPNSIDLPDWSNEYNEPSYDDVDEPSFGPEGDQQG